MLESVHRDRPSSPTAASIAGAVFPPSDDYDSSLRGLTTASGAREALLSSLLH